MSISAILFKVILFSLMLFLSGCNQKGSAFHEVSNSSFSFDKTKWTNISAVPNTLDNIIDIADIRYHDGSLILVSEMDSFAFHLMDASNFSFKGKFGKRGDGPDEIIEPDILLTDKNGIMLIDSWKHRLYNGNDTLSTDDELMNMPNEIKFPIIGYYRLNGNGREFCTRNLSSSQMCDSILIPDVNHELKDSPFFWSTNGTNAVLSFVKSNTVLIINIENGVMTHVNACRYNMTDGNYTFLAPVCRENDFIILANRYGDDAMSDDCPFSSLLFCDYSGKPVNAVKLDVTGTRIAYDPNKNRCILGGYDDGILYTVNLE